MSRLVVALGLVVTLAGPAAASHDERGRDSRGDCEASDNCQDNDFSPDFEDSPVIVCLPSSTCNFA